MFLIVFFVALVLGSRVEAAVTSPIVSLPYGTFEGFNTGNLTKFLGIPFAHVERFKIPKAPRLLHGVQNATEFGPACPQQKLTPSPLFVQSTYPVISEDCLNLNVFKPFASNSSKLPVFVWIYGGGFEFGNSRDTDVSPLVERSIDTNEPIIIVTPNYCVTALGFLAGKEVGAAGISNLGTRDQIYALEWARKHISAFGGDPDRVVVGGQSAGAISTALLLLSNKQSSNALFRGAFMQSGSPFKTPSLAEGQSDYDNLVAANNCTASFDTLDCLRRVPFEALMATVNQTLDILSYRSLSNVWQPRIDGDVLAEAPLVDFLVNITRQIPIMTGDCDDEGTLFSFAEANITTSAEFLDYVHSNYLPASSPEEIARVGMLYPDDPTQGSPFNTGTANQLTPEYKRLAAFQGDLIFNGPRRSFLEHASARQDAWSWLSKRGKSMAVGAYHGSDFPIWFLLGNTTETIGADALLNFINTLDPNRPAASSTIKPGIFWPKWNTPSSAGNTSLLTFSDPDVVNITAENFRVNAIGFLNGLLFEEAARGGK
ncbi:carotenoid ester lipase precursor [Mycena latifolia]|nr:carotenoid ester lipase precursor [Mycena latifolia]